MVDSILSVDQILANAKAAAQSGSGGAKSTVQELLEGRDPEDIVEISPVQKLVQERTAATEKESYFDSDDFLRLKVGQLQSQLAIYSSIPGLDPNGAVMASIEAEIKDIITRQIEKANAIDEEGKEATAAREKQLERDKNLAPSPEQMINNALNSINGTTALVTLSKDAQALLDNLGSNVDTSA